MSDHDPECPYRKHKHFEVEKENCARGAHGNISVIKIKNKEFIWKRPVSKEKLHQKSFKKEIEKSKTWRILGLSKVKICWHPDKKSLIKTYIKGPTLKRVLREHPHFFSNTHSRSYKALGKFVKRLVKSRHYIQDCNRINIVYDNEEHRWHLIDSSNIQRKRSRHETASKYKQTFLSHWGQSINLDNEKEAFKKFLDNYCK